MSTTYQEEYEKVTTKAKLDRHTEEQSLMQDIPLLDELHHLWILGEKEKFFERLRQAVREEEVSEKLLKYLSKNLKEKNLEKANNILGKSKKAKKVLTASVGRGGVNKGVDVKLVQGLLNTFSVLKVILLVDGKMGRKSITAILRFQRIVLGVASPDGRVDVGGRTLNALLGNRGAKKQTVVRVEEVVDAGSTSQVQFGASAKKDIVSQKTRNVINMALDEAGMNAAMITSSIRSPERQARIMYDNALKNLQGQKDLYGATGDRILKVFEQQHKKKRSRADVIKLMARKIEELSVGDAKVSRHCVSSAQYSEKNVIDIGLNSTKAVAGNSFNQESFTKALSRLTTKGLISKFIDETGRSNTTWHVEIKQ